MSLEGSAVSGHAIRQGKAPSQIPRGLSQMLGPELLTDLNLLADILAPHEDFLQAVIAEDPGMLFLVLNELGIYKDLHFIKELGEKWANSIQERAKEPSFAREAKKVQRNEFEWKQRIQRERPLLSAFIAELDYSMGILATVASRANYVLNLHRRKGILDFYDFEKLLKATFGNDPLVKKDPETRAFITEFAKTLFYLRSRSGKGMPKYEEDRAKIDQKMKGLLGIFRTESFIRGKVARKKTEENSSAQRAGVKEVILQLPEEQGLFELLRVAFKFGEPIPNEESIVHTEDYYLIFSVSRISGELCLVTSGYASVEPLFRAYQVPELYTLFKGEAADLIEATFNQGDFFLTEEDWAQSNGDGADEEEPIDETIKDFRKEIRLSELETSSAPGLEVPVENRKKPGRGRVRYTDKNRILRALHSLGASVLEQNGNSHIRIHGPHSKKVGILPGEHGSASSCDLHLCTCHLLRHLNLDPKAFRVAYQTGATCRN